MKNLEQLDRIKKVTENKELLKQFVQSYFMTYDYSKKQWQIEDFTNMVKSVEAMADLPGIKESAKFREEISKATKAFQEMHKQVEKEYYDKNSGVFGAITRVGDYLRPLSSLPADVQELKSRLDSNAQNIRGVGKDVSTIQAQGASTAIGGVGKTSPHPKANVNIDIAELASVLKDKKSPSTLKNSTKQI